MNYNANVICEYWDLEKVVIMKVHQKVLKYISDNVIKQKFIADKTGITENILSMMLKGKNERKCL